MSKSRRIGAVLIVVALVPFLGYAGYGYWKVFHKSSSKSPAPSAQSQNGPALMTFTDRTPSLTATLDLGNFNPSVPLVQAVTYQNHSNNAISSLPITITNKAGPLVISPTGAKLTILACSTPWKTSPTAAACSGTQRTVLPATKLSNAPLHVDLGRIAPGADQNLVVEVSVPKNTPGALLTDTVTVVLDAAPRS